MADAPHLCLLGDANSPHTRRWALEMRARGWRVSLVTARPEPLDGVEQRILAPVQRQTDWLLRTSAAQRAVRELARETGKAIELVLLGETTELDRKVIEALSEEGANSGRQALDRVLKSAIPDAVAHDAVVLRDDGITYHQYVTELTYLLFLKMAKETGTEKELPRGFRWDDLAGKNGMDQLTFYRAALLHLGTEATGRVQAPARTQRVYASTVTSVRSRQYPRRSTVCCGCSSGAPSPAGLPIEKRPPGMYTAPPGQRGRVARSMTLGAPGALGALGAGASATPPSEGARSRSAIQRGALSAASVAARRALPAQIQRRQQAQVRTAARPAMQQQPGLTIRVSTQVPGHAVRRPEVEVALASPGALSGGIVFADNRVRLELQQCRQVSSHDSCQPQLETRHAVDHPRLHRSALRL